MGGVYAYPSLRLDVRCVGIYQAAVYQVVERYKTMHRQQRVRSSSRWSSLALPLSSAGSSIGTVSVSPRTRTSTSIPMPVCARAGMSTSTVASSALLSQPLQPSQASQPSQTSLSSLFLPSSVSWSTSSLSSCSWGVQQTSCSRLSSLAGTREAGIASTVSVNGIAWPRLVSVLAWSVTLLLVSSCIGLTDAGILNGHPLGKRSFIDIQCKGIYDKSIFARLDRICEDCYNLFREPQLHQLCRKNCFTSDYFKGCLDVLLLQDEVEKIQTWIKQLHGAEPGV